MKAVVLRAQLGYPLRAASTCTAQRKPRRRSRPHAERSRAARALRGERSTARALGPGDRRAGGRSLDALGRRGRARACSLRRDHLASHRRATVARVLARRDEGGRERGVNVVTLEFMPGVRRCASLAARLRREVRRRGAVRRREPRPLFDRRVDLPGRAHRRRRAAQRRRRACRDRRSRSRRACRCCRAAPAPRSAARRWAPRSSSTTRKYLEPSLEFDAAARDVIVQPGVVLDTLNAQLRPHGLWFPVDVSTSAQATIGGMAGNNSCGSRSIRYGNMVHNVLAIDAVLADGIANGASARATSSRPDRAGYRELVGKRPRARLSARRRDRSALPKVLRRVAGYNLELHRGSRPTRDGPHQPRAACWSAPKARSPSRAHSPQARAAAAAQGARRVPLPDASTARWSCTQHIVKLGPAAVELVDRTMIGLARGNPAFRADRRRASSRASPTRSCSSSSPATTRRASSKLDAARRTHGRPRAAGQRGGDHRRRTLQKRRVGSAQGGPQHHDVDEGRREAGVASSRIARCRSSTSPSTPTG